CALSPERESKWAQEKLLGGDFDGGFIQIAALSTERLSQLTPLLRRFEAERRRGRDRLYKELCYHRPAPATELAAACRELRPEQEPKWWAEDHAQRVMDLDHVYYGGGRMLAWMFLVLSLVTLGSSFLSARRRTVRVS